LEPEQINPIGQYRAASQDDDGDNGHKDKECAAMRPRRK
jgi:hypothetical protein